MQSINDPIATSQTDTPEAEIKDVMRYIDKLKPVIEKMFGGEKSGHDINHLERVLNLALHIQEKEGGDRDVIGVSTYLHDIHRLMENESHTFHPPKESLPVIQEMLESVEFPKEKIQMVLHAVEFHEEYGFSEEGKTVTDIETLILQDADNLDAIGAIGIGRTFAFSGAHGIPMWIPEKPFDRQTFDESERDPSTLHHFHAKLLKLGDNMNTETAKAMAKERHLVMQKFVDTFMKEWKGKI